MRHLKYRKEKQNEKNFTIVLVLCSMWLAIAVIGWQDSDAGMVSVVFGFITTVIVMMLTE